MSTIAITTKVARELAAAVPDLLDVDLLPSYNYSRVTLALADCNDKTLDLLISLLTDKEDKAALSIVKATVNARATKGESIVKSLFAVPAALQEWVTWNAARGWLVRKTNGKPDQMFLVVDAKYEEASQYSTAGVNISLLSATPGRAAGRDEKTSREHVSIVLESEDLFAQDPADPSRNKRQPISVILANKGFFAPTEDDFRAYDEVTERFWNVLSTGFAEQFLLTGRITPAGKWGGQAQEVESVKVIHDMKTPSPTNARVALWGTSRSQSPTFGAVPVTPTLRVFNLASQEFGTVSTEDLTRYEYDPSLRDKLVLPETHRELLDVLTTDLDDYTADIIEGKSAGNVILTRGRPGVGKTLTAEVYSELIERPLYSIHSGTLGVTADNVRERLSDVFALADRWNAVLLLDEADVFVIERGQSITQNAIVAEFLRTLEYFKGLMFMTTNRGDDIDDAILSRCAAIITYRTPEAGDARKVWDVLVENAGASEQVPPRMRDDLVARYPHLAPRDVKMVLRLALRIAQRSGGAPTMDVFARCILFRGLTETDTGEEG